MSTTEGTHAHTNHVGLGHTIGIAVNIAQAIGKLGGRNCAVEDTERAQYNVRTRGHATISAHMATSSNAGSVGAVCTVTVIGGQAINLVIHKDRPRQTDSFVVTGGMARSVGRTVDPLDASQRGIVTTPEGKMLIVIAHIHNCYNYASSVVGLRQPVMNAVENLSRMCHTQCGIGTQHHPAADFHIGDTRHHRHRDKVVHRNLSGHKAVKTAVDDNTRCLQFSNSIISINGNECINHFLAVNHAGREEPHKPLGCTDVQSPLVKKLPDSNGQDALGLRIPGCQHHQANAGKNDNFFQLHSPNSCRL